MPSITLICKTCNHTARRKLMNVVACRGINETPSEPATCPNCLTLMVRKDERVIFHEKSWNYLVENKFTK